MFKQILVPVTGTATDATVFATALLVAKRFGAHIEFLHVRVDVAEIVVAMTAGGVGGGVQDMVDRLENDVRAQEAKAWQAFTDFCTQAGMAPGGAAPGGGACADMAIETGSEANWVADYGRFADLVVAGRLREDGSVASDVLEAVLMDTARPLLIVPATAPRQLGKTVAIAWKDAAEATRAVSAAMPLIAAADQVLILSVAETDDAPDPTAERLQRSLRWHNPRTGIRYLTRDGRTPVEALTAELSASGADLLVMGGYSHGRLRETVLGGFTREIVQAAEVPVLMAH